MIVRNHAGSYNNYCVIDLLFIVMPIIIILVLVMHNITLLHTCIIIL